MNTTLSQAPRFRWTPQQLADAVPLRLTQLIDFNALRSSTPAAANSAHCNQRSQTGYLPTPSGTNAFRVR
ncbi:MAG: hypothetical protein IT472_11160 [Thermomonas sp.]|uniref:hypothetical protein n=1 Tax=Thermomonas sp. TaxID=1971895 RepID=UPI00260AF6FE|nr:hypothetical protein [Thermomonas sp.]MCC7097726.1 hypothetical protein [Thermomonas sp.]